MISLSVLKALNVIQMTGTKTSKAIMINIKAGQSGCGKTGRDRRSGSDAAAVAKLGTFTCVSGRKNETA